MHFYKITTETGEEYAVESKSPMSDRRALEEAVDQHLIDEGEASESSVEEIDEEQYEELLLIS
jgi:hypothetical protein